MSNKGLVLKENIFDIAKEIRQSLGISETYKPRELAQAIHNAVEKYKQNNPTSTVTNGMLTNAYDVPLQKLKVEGNSTQEGTPSPEFPSEIKSVGDKTKNLFNKEMISHNQRISAIGIPYDDAGYYISDFIQIEGGKTYTKNSPSDDAYHRMAFYSDNSYESFISKTENNKETAPQNAKYLKICGLETELNNTQIEQGPATTPYEPYGYKVPVVVSGKNLFNAEEFVAEANTIESGKAEITTYLGKTCLKYKDAINNLRFMQGQFKESTQYTIKFKQARSGYLPTSTYEIMRFHYTDGTDTAVSSSNLSDEWLEISRTSAPGKTIDYIYVAEYANHLYIYLDLSTLQLEENTTATQYEPYHEPITKTIYLDEPLRGIGDAKDELDFVRRKIARNFAQYVFTGLEEGFGFGNHQLSTNILSLAKIPTSNGTPFIGYSNKYKVVGKWYTETTNYVCAINTSGYLYIKNDNWDDIAEAKADIAGTEVMYELATPTETDFTPEQNAVADEIMYTKLWEGTNIITLGTEVQPSEINATYITKVGV